MKIGFGGTVEAFGSGKGIATHKWKPLGKILAGAYDTPSAAGRGNG